MCHSKKSEESCYQFVAVFGLASLTHNPKPEAYESNTCPAKLPRRRALSPCSASRRQFAVRRPAGATAEPIRIFRSDPRGYTPKAFRRSYLSEYLPRARCALVPRTFHLRLLRTNRSLRAGKLPLR